MNNPLGPFILTMRLAWDAHEQPYDLTRYSSFGIHQLAKRHWLRVILARHTLAEASFFAQLWLAHLCNATRPAQGSARKPRLAAMILLPTNLAGLALGKLLPSSPDLYLDNVMVWSKQARSGKADGRE